MAKDESEFEHGNGKTERPPLMQVRGGLSLVLTIAHKPDQLSPVSRSLALDCNISPADDRCIVEFLVVVGSVLVVIDHLAS